MLMLYYQTNQETHYMHTKKKDYAKEILHWPQSSFGFFHRMLQKNPNELCGQPNTYIKIYIK